MRISRRPQDSLKFKTPTLRNLYFSSNFMHDGRFNTVSQCINHYRSGIQMSPTLDLQLINGITLNNTETSDLVSFLQALTDSGFVSNPAYSK
jgi:cytochrome c peroxidase